LYRYVLGTFRDPVSGDVILGDVVIGMNGEAVKNSSDLYKILDDLQVGDEVEMTVQRGGQERVTVKVTLGEKVTRFDA
jgi:S1-C subfamily serine protease